MRRTAYSSGVSGIFSAVVCPLPLSSLPSHLWAGSSDVYKSRRSVSFVDGARVPQSIEIEFRIPFSSIVIVLGNTSIFKHSCHRDQQLVVQLNCPTLSGRRRN